MDYQISLNEAELIESYFQVKEHLPLELGVQILDFEFHIFDETGSIICVCTTVESIGTFIKGFTYSKELFLDSRD